MGEKLGELIRQGRLQLGWEQSELAQRLGSAGQQSVSRWERGLSRPDRGVLRQISAILGLSESRLLAAAGHQSEIEVDSGASPPPLRTRLAKLPFHLLSAEGFENFTADLVRHLYPGAEAVRNGEPGFKQDGADVIVRTTSGDLIAIQCKQVKEFGPARVRAVVDGMRLSADKCYLYLSRTASPSARKEIARYPGWQIRDARDLSADVRYLRDQGAAAQLVDAYFGGSYRELFLGIADPGPWLTPSAFFRTETEDSIYTHNWVLAGRAAELESLTAFLDDHSRPVALVIGTAGIGKSRLLREFASSCERCGEGIQIRFLARNALVGSRDFEALPPDGQVVVVIDDAHDRSGLGDVIKGIRRASPDAKIVLSLRPQGRGQLRADLREARLHPADVLECCLAELDIRAAEALAAEALGRRSNAALPRQLAALAADCPLLIVVGGALIRRGHLDVGGLASGAIFRDEIMTAFRDNVAAADAAGNPDVRQEVLNAIAALQPFRVSQPAFHEALTGLTGKPFDQLMPHIRRLEEAGVLLRRGDSLRIVPDLLGDVILAEAAADVPSGTSTRYLERVLTNTRGDCLLHLLDNASRVDWQVRTGNPASMPLADSVWPVIVNRFRGGDVAERLQLLEVLRAVAFFQPGRTIELVRWAMANPSPMANPSDLTDHAPGGRRVLDALPAILENAAYNREYLGQAADLLWELAGWDQRPPSQHPGHPIRILQGLIEYNLIKSTDFHDLIVEAASGWLRAADSADWLYSPFEVLKPLLVTAVTKFTGNGRTFTFKKYAMSASAVRGLRCRVLDLAFAEARSSDPRRAVNAMNAIEASIRYEDPADPGELQQWTPEFVDTIERIGDLFSGPDLDPTVSVAARHALWWHAAYSQTDTRHAAEGALRRLPNSASHNLALVLHDGWGHMAPRGTDAAESESLREQVLRNAAGEAADTWPDDDQLIDQVEQRIIINRRAFRRRGSPRPLIWTLARDRPGAARVICERVRRDPDSVLLDVLPAALSPLADILPDEAISQALDLVSTGNTAVTRYVAEAFGFARGNRSTLLDGEDDLLRSLLSNEDAETRSLAVTAAVSVARTTPGLTLDLLASVRFADSAVVAEAVAGAFGPYSGLSWAELPVNQADQIIRQLRDSPSIDSHEITNLLAEIARFQPERVINLLKDRVEIWDNNETLRGGYLPLPRTWGTKPEFKAHESYPSLLCEVIEWIAVKPSAGRLVMGAEIFASVADGFDEQATAILIDAVRSDDINLVKAGSAVLREIPVTHIWNQDFVSRVLNASARLGMEYAEVAGNNLMIAAINNSPPGTLGQRANKQGGQHDTLTMILSEIAPGSLEERFYQALATWNQNLARLEGDITVQRPERRRW